MRQLMPLRENELATLIREVGPVEHVDIAFGPSGSALVWDDETPITKSVELLARMRGVLTENCDGDGV